MPSNPLLDPKSEEGAITTAVTKSRLVNTARVAISPKHFHQGSMVMTAIRQRFERCLQHLGRWYPLASAALILLTCAAWIWLLSGIGQPSSVPITPPVPTTPQGREPITPVPAPPQSDPNKVALGEALFGDPRLFNDGRVSCASCHDTNTNGASRHRFDPTLDIKLRVNTPTVFNAALNFRLDWFGDQDTLEQQAVNALRTNAAAPSDPEAAAARLNRDADIIRQFKQIYGHAADRQSLLDAIATYERSLVTPSSRFDRWVEGDGSALSSDEVVGYRNFKSMGCIACHQGSNVGGNIFERSGVFHPLTDDGPISLRVPSLRNVAATAPYFHDGSAPTLVEAVRRMASAQLNRNLSDQETQSIVAFLKTLTGEYRGTTVRAQLP